ncbi:MAG TPA: hypothetical protein VEA69_16705 [Tepidisphaeraceae bacterium]|nr:hypothetical protein [Tepidisphaeraceae bacterium]
MPAESTLNFKYVDNVATNPSHGGTNSTGVHLGVRPAGAVWVNTVTGKRFHQLPTGNNAVLPACELVDRFVLTERFLQRPVLNADLASGTEATREPANNNWEVLGTNATSALTTFADGGGITLTTAGASGDLNVIAPHLDTAQTAWAAAKWNTNDEISFETTVKTGASVANMKFWAGFKLTNTSVTATDDDQAYFLFDTGNTNAVSATNIQICTSRAGTDTVVDSGVTVEASTSYHLLLQVDQHGVPYFFINGVLVAIGNGTESTGVTTSTGALTANIDLIPYVGVHALAAAAKSITVRGVVCGKTMND